MNVILNTMLLVLIALIQGFLIASAAASSNETPQLGECSPSPEREAHECRSRKLEGQPATLLDKLEENVVKAEEAQAKSQEPQQQQQEEVASECTLYLAPSSIPGAGLGVYTSVDLSTGSPVGEMDELLVPIIDRFKTLPYRGQQKFLSWLGYVWPEKPFAFDHMATDEPFPPVPMAMSQVKEGLNAADGLAFYDGNHRVSVFAPGIASMANSHMQQANLVKADYDPGQRKDWAGLTFGKDHGVGAFTPHHGVGFTASKDIAAGSELLINYGMLWHHREDQKNRTKDETFPTLEDFNNGRLNEVNLPDEAARRKERQDTFEHQERLRQKIEFLMKGRAQSEAEKVGDETVAQITRDLGKEDGAKEEEGNEEKSRLHVIFRLPDGRLDKTRMAAVDVYEDEDVYTLIHLLHRLEIPRTFWGVARVKLEGNAVQRKYLESTDHPPVYERIQFDEVLGDMLAKEGYVVVLMPDFDAIEKLNNTPHTKGLGFEQMRAVEDRQTFSKSVDWLKENGMCIDNVRVGQSTVAQAGRGSFAKRSISKGALIAPAPLLALKRDDLVIYEADGQESKFRDVLNLEEVVGQEILLNYCYGHPESPLLLLPYSPVVSSINHNSQEPNAVIRWPENPSLGDPKEWLDLHPLDVLEMSGDLTMEVVALRDIMPGEEIFIDYGHGWEDAWKRYEEEQKQEAAAYNFVHGAFRHEIGVPDGFFPDTWNNKSVVYEPALPISPLKPGEIAPVVWAHNGKPVTKTAWMVGLPPGFSDHMLQYSNEMGITKMYDTLLEGDPLKSNEWFVFDTKGEKWFAQRYESKSWSFNIHYIAAWDEAARVSFLRALGKGGYDTVLESIGNHFGYENITCFHLSFMGVSECDKSVTHADVYASGEKGLNIIFPIVTVDGSKPELDIQSDNTNIVTSVKYTRDLAYIMSDYGYHKTSSIEYEGKGQNRVVVGMYCGQIDESNAEMMKYIYDGEHPAPFLDQFNLPLADPHWSVAHSLPK